MKGSPYCERTEPGWFAEPLNTITGLAYLLALRLGTQRAALLAALGTLAVLIAVRNDAFPVFPALALAMAAMLCLERGLSRGAGWLFAAGLLVGLLTTFRHDLGAYAATAAGMWFLLLAAIQQQWPAWLQALRRIAWFALGLFLVVVPMAVMLFTTVPLPDLYFSLIHSPATIYPDVRSLPFPGLETLRNGLDQPLMLSELAVYLPFLAVALATVLEYRALRRGRKAGQTVHAQLLQGRALLPLLVLTCLLFTLKGLVRVSPIHMVQSIVLGLVLLAAVSGQIDWRRSADRLTAVPAFLLVVALSLPVAALGGQWLLNGARELLYSEENLITRCRQPVLPRMRCVSSDADSISAARYIMRHSPDHARIYVGAGRHDKLFLNPVAFYFMAERHSATRWHELHPGIQTRATVQAEMVAELRADPPYFVVLDSRWDHVREANASQHATGATLLDAHLQSHYAEETAFGAIRILRMREPAARD